MPSAFPVFIWNIHSTLHAEVTRNEKKTATLFNQCNFKNPCIFRILPLFLINNIRMEIVCNIKRYYHYQLIKI